MGELDGRDGNAAADRHRPGEGCCPRWRAHVARLSAALVALSPTAALAAERSAPPMAISEGLRACPGGGFALPDSRTCLRLGGAVRAEASVAKPKDTQRLTRLGTDARVSLDVRTPTELGPVRVFTAVRLRGATGTGR